MPVIPTVVVTLAVAAMIALGLWQLLIRLPEKEAFLAQLAANPAKPAIAFPAVPDDRLLFRRVTATCLQPTAIRLAGAGKAGYRAVADCRTGAEDDLARRAPGAAADHGLVVQLGTTRDPKAKVAWAGGPVSGHIAQVPGGQTLIGSLVHPVPARMMLVSAAPLAGLSLNPPPDVDAVPNNHLAYAVQWFFFAAVAAIIYLLALRRRGR